jgi:hypothetical protein
MWVNTIVAVVLVGVATWYPLDVYGGNPLYCDRDGTLVYTEEATTPWVAISDEMYLAGWECGDWVRLQFGDGTTLWAQALDAGPLDHYQADGQPIVVDVPEPFWPYDLGRLSAPVTVFNESLANRLIADAAFGHIAAADRPRLAGRGIRFGFTK